MQTPDLVVAKTNDDVVAGGNGTYHIDITNAGGAPTSGLVTVTDTLDPSFTVTSASGPGWVCTSAQTVSCTRADSLPAGAKYPTIDVDVTVASGATDLSNTVLVAGGGDGDPSNNTGTDQVDVVEQANLSVAKTVSPGRIRNGETATYQMVVRNNGPADATGVTLDDAPLPAGDQLVSTQTSRGTCDTTVTCDIGTLAAGSSAIIEVTVRGAAAGTATNTATVSGNQPDPASADDTSSPPTRLDVVATADLSITKSAQPSVIDVGTIGAQVTHTLTVHNAGPQTATGIVVDDPVAPELTVVSVSPTLDKVGPTDPAQPGDTITYTLKTRNRGPSTAVNTTATDMLPAGLTFGSSPSGCTAAGQTVTCALGDIAPGQTPREASIVVRAERSLAGRAVTNTASVRSALDDPVEPSNRDLWAIDVAPAPPAPVAAASVTPPASVPPECLAGVLRLVDVLAGAHSVHLAGETAKVNAGKVVTLLFAGRQVATATVTANGTFSAAAPLPSRAVRRTNKARYEAVLGTLRSPALKLVRRMHATELSSSGKVTIAGRVTGPLARPVRTVTLRQYKDCRGTAYTVVKRNIKVSSAGRFRATVPAPSGQEIAYYRAVTRVRKTTRNRKTYPTFTLIRGVVLRRA